MLMFLQRSLHDDKGVETWNLGRDTTDLQDDINEHL